MYLQSTTVTNDNITTPIEFGIRVREVKVGIQWFVLALFGLPISSEYYRIV